MDNIIPKYNINIENNFMFLKQQELEEFMDFNADAHSHNFYILSFLYEGTIDHYSDFDNKSVSAPAILMLDIDQVHTHPEIGSCKMISIAFSTDFISSETDYFLEKVTYLFSKSFLPISTAQLKELDEIIEIESKEIKKEFPNEELIKALLNVLIIQCLAISDSIVSANDDDYGIYHDFKKLLNKNYRKQHQLNFYANELNITTAILNKNIKRSTFKTPKQLIDQHLLLEAKRILFWSKMSVKEVAYELGFETDSYFNHFFKKHIGETPKEFQRKQSAE
nr:AraC family transcriptional regulator [uncultured Chryseobacterium sp.]